MSRPSSPASKRSRSLGRAHTGVFVRWFVVTAGRAVRSVAGFAIGYAALVLAALGVFRYPDRTSTPQLLALLGLTILLLARLFARLQPGRSARVWDDLELGTLFIAATFVVLEITGGPTGLLYPLVYALVAFLVAFHSFGQSVYFLALILGAEASILWIQPVQDGWRVYASHTSFVLLFGLLYTLFLRTEVRQQRRSVHSEIESKLDHIAAEARDFRLTSGSSLHSRKASAEELAWRRKVGSVQAIRESLYNVLAVAERALKSHTVALLWMSANDERLLIKELRSMSDHVTERPLGVGEGFVGAVTKRREPLVLTNLKPGHPGLIYYTRPQSVTDFAAVPVLDGQYLRGVLLADRCDGRPFDEGELAVLNTLAGEIVRVVQVERIFCEMDREKYQKEHFYQASQAFNSALTIDQVAKVAIETAQRITQVEFAAVAVATEREGNLRIAALSWKDKSAAEEWLGEEFAGEEGLVGAAIKARHALPHGTARSASQPIFSAALPFDLPGVKVMPLLWKDSGVGALVLGSQRQDFLPFDMFEMIRVVSDHAAIAIANAQMFHRMERMATTDGLTRLVNHRRFQEAFDDCLARAERYKHPLSLILTDIDHFKLVNDTYGHPVGDKVLQRVAEVLTACARRTDVVARYGGEEFAVLMEQTDRKGALHIAERMRQAVEAEDFHSDLGSFKCTLSLGIATYPEEGTEKPRIIELADQALYHAKHAGRNRAVAYSSLRSRREVS